MKISGSLVLFHNNPAQYEVAISCFLNSCADCLYVVDNSSPPLENSLFKHPRIRYISTGANLGFGAAHNLAIAMVGTSSDAHLILNPDIAFGVDVIEKLGGVLDLTPETGALMPRINYPDGSIQYLCKLLPTPIDLIFRRFVPLKSIRFRINRRYEMQKFRQDLPINAPSLSGCFLLVRTRLLHLLHGFDERYFMYMEDVDLVRRIGDICNTIYYPLVSVEHAYAKGSYRNLKLLGYHLRSAIKYFNKWGWVFDSTRRRRNNQALQFLNRQTQLG